MRLSEAIRLGAMLGGQTIGSLSRGTSTCALGAAYLAAGLLTERRRNVEIVKAVRTFPAMVAPCTACPCCSPAQCRDLELVDLADVITHLNDFHMWSREQIADWVETIERREESTSADALDPHASDPGTLTTRGPTSSSS